MKYRVVKISNNVPDYPECKQDTEEYPHLVRRVNDEMDIFIVDEVGNYWPADEFFSMIEIRGFAALTQDREAARVAFEADAGPYDFDLTRTPGEPLTAEPWAEYVDEATGHRWAGWLARTGDA